MHGQGWRLMTEDKLKSVSLKLEQQGSNQSVFHSGGPLPSHGLILPARCCLDVVGIRECMKKSSERSLITEVWLGSGKHLVTLDMTCVPVVWIFPWGTVCRYGCSIRGTGYNSWQNVTSGHPDVTADLPEMPPGNWWTFAGRHACLAVSPLCFTKVL